MHFMLTYLHMVGTKVPKNKTHHGIASLK